MNSFRLCAIQSVARLSVLGVEACDAEIIRGFGKPATTIGGALRPVTLVFRCFRLTLLNSHSIFIFRAESYILLHRSF